jgi:hypothetical protein
MKEYQITMRTGEVIIVQAKTYKLIDGHVIFYGEDDHSVGAFRDYSHFVLVTPNDKERLAKLQIEGLQRNDN